MLRNPTAGTIVSGASAVAMNANRNFGSANTATAAIYSGKVGGTLTGGTDLGILQCFSL